MINHPHNPAPVDQRMTTEEASALYTITGFCAPFVEVIRKSDGTKGTLEFNGMPRYYFNFREV